MAEPTDGWNVDLDQITVPTAFSGSVDVWFGGHRGWSFTTVEGERTVRWPRTMRGFLKGWSEVRLSREDQALHVQHVVFGPEPDELEMVDRHRLPVIVDKWGLIQRPFEFRAEGLLGQLADEAERIMTVLEHECQLPSWISFGTLLGAARSGKAIGHDSDIDLCYLSRLATPAEMTVELWRIGRVLRAHGWRVLHKSGSFLTVEVDAADGGSVGIDVYATFHLDGNFYETATVRRPVPLSAVLPITPIEFEGRMLNGPASPERLLEISYGPNWRVPDPSFRHEPGPEITDRFDEWFGHLWRQRREWRSANAAHPSTSQTPVSEFATWLLDLLSERHRVVEVGSGNGADALALARAGHKVRALDYAFGPRRSFPQHPGLTRLPFNLYDLRDVVTRGALVARARRGQVVCARDVLETLTDQGLEHFFLFTGMALRGGGLLAIESHAWSAGALADRAQQGTGGRIRRLDPSRVLAAARAAGGELVRSEGLTAARATLAAPGAPDPSRWRLLVSWPEPSAHTQTDPEPSVEAAE